MSIMPSAGRPGAISCNWLEIQTVDLKVIDFDQPCLRVIALQNAFASEDITARAKPLAGAAE